MMQHFAISVKYMVYPLSSKNIITEFVILFNPILHVCV